MATKAYISQKISKATNISLKESKKILNNIIDHIKINSKNKNVKIGGFGTFYKHKTPERLGRDPKTKKLYKIKSRKVIKFKASSKVKEILN